MNATAMLVSMALPLSLVFILPLASKKYRARLVGDPVEAIMFGAAAVLAFALLASAAIVMQTHNFAVVEVVMLATGAFAIAGIAFGLFRSLRAAKRVA